MRFRRKPERHERDQVAARWDPGEPDSALACKKVAQMADSGAELAVVTFATGRPVLIVRYCNMSGDRGFTDYEHIEPGHWLACSDGEFLYDTDDAGWAQWYDRVED
jgi:hypothetical protein